MRTTKIAEAANVWNPALAVIRALGFDCSVELVGDDQMTWSAYRGGDQYSASDPTTLLGIVSVGLFRGPEWRQRRDEPDLYEELLRDALT
jgi:hypothetical protein